MQCKKHEDFIKEYQYYRTILDEYKKTGKIFNDHYFHPYLNIKEIEVDLDANKIEWRRIDEVYKAPLFDENLINSKYVIQGEIADCYFISALSRVAKQPKLVERLFDKTADEILGKVNKSINIKCGAVVIFFHAYGKETPVLIDTRIPFIKGTTKPIFASPPNKSVSPWFCLVEKAYAKLFGSYSNISWGYFTASIYSLFGYQPLLKRIDELKSEFKHTKKTIFQRIQDYKKQGAVMDCYISNEDMRDSNLDKVGLVSRHSYLILKVVDFKGMHFIHLRNPWGNFVWKGDWSDNSPLWTKEIKDALKMKKSDDGSFWMIEKDFIRYFDMIEISRPIPTDWHSKTFSLEMWPGIGDGCDVYNPEAHFGKKPNYGIKIIQKVPLGHKVPLYFLVERRSYLHGKVKYIDNEPSKFQFILALSNGKKLSKTVMHSYICNVYNTNDDISYCKFELNDPCSIVTVGIQRLEKRMYYDECSIRVSCAYEFELFNLDNPKLFVADNSTFSKVFETVTCTNNNFIVQRKDDKNKNIKKFQKNQNDEDNKIHKPKKIDNFKDKNIHKHNKVDDFGDEKIYKPKKIDNFNDKNIHKHKRDADFNDEEKNMKKKKKSIKDEVSELFNQQIKLQLEANKVSDFANKNRNLAVKADLIENNLVNLEYKFNLLVNNEKIRLKKDDKKQKYYDDDDDDEY